MKFGYAIHGPHSSYTCYPVFDTADEVYADSARIIDLLGWTNIPVRVRLLHEPEDDAES